MSIYDRIEAQGAGDAEKRRQRNIAAAIACSVLAVVGVRMWLHRVPPPPSMTSYAQIDGVVSASFDEGTLEIIVGTDMAALDAGGRTEAVLALIEQTGTLEYHVMVLRDTAGEVVGRGYPDGHVRVPD